MTSIRISQLNNLATVTTDDFVAMVDSGSLTTYRSPVSSLINALANSTVSSSISSSWASSSLSASYSTTSSYAISSSYALTSSYAFSSSFSTTASYVDPSSLTIALATNATFATSASWASSSISASYASTSSWALNVVSASYALSSSHAILSDRAITASNADTASYVLNASSEITGANYIIGLSIYPHWTPYDVDSTLVEISASSLVVYDGPGNSVRLSNVRETIDRDVVGAGGLDTGTITPGNWYDIYVIYNSGTADVSAIISDAGTTPSGSVPTYPSGYDYRQFVGSVKDESGTTWREWYEFGSNTRWSYRNACPTSTGLSNGKTITFYYKDPKISQFWYKFRSTDATDVTNGFSTGDQFDFMNGFGDTPVSFLLSPTQAKVYANSWGTPSMSRPTDGSLIGIPVAKLDYIINLTF